jgi:alpha-mannosidase
LVQEDIAESLVLDTVKRGHDDQDISRCEGLRVNKGKSVIARVYESLGGQARGSICTTFDVKRVAKVNILEYEIEEIPVKDGRFSIKLRPFEVATFKLQL